MKKVIENWKLIADYYDITLFSPIMHNHQASIFCDINGNWDFWKTFCINMLDKCDEMYVFMIDGWESSVGVWAEIEYALNNNKKLYFIEEKDFKEV